MSDEKKPSVYMRNDGRKPLRYRYEFNLVRGAKHLCPKLPSPGCEVVFKLGESNNRLVITNHSGQICAWKYECPVHQSDFAIDLAEFAKSKGLSIYMMPPANP